MKRLHRLRVAGHAVQRLLAGLFCVVLILAGCGDGEEPPPASGDNPFNTGSRVANAPPSQPPTVHFPPPSQVDGGEPGEMEPPENMKEKTPEPPPEKPKEPEFVPPAFKEPTPPPLDPNEVFGKPSEPNPPIHPPENHPSEKSTDHNPSAFDLNPQNLVNRAPKSSGELTSAWTQFRGPNGSGIGRVANLPVRWSDTENLLWKYKLPGPGASSPIAIDGKVILTCYSGYGVLETSAGFRNLQRHVLCLDASSGRLLWDYTAPLSENPNARVSPYSGFIREHGYSSSTPVTDGRNVYLQFGSSGILVLTLDGREFWKQPVSVGNGTHSWGSGASPILFKDLLIVNASVESGMIGALNRTTGEVVWKRDDVQRCWGTPVIARAIDGSPELVLSAEKEVFALNPEDGTDLWRCDGIGDYVCPSVAVGPNRVFAIGGRAGQGIAIRTGGKGDVTKSHVAWSTNKGSNIPSPLYHDGHFYWVSNKGIGYVLKAESGEIVTQRRLMTGTIYASMISGDGKLYVVSRDNGTFVYKASPLLEVITQNRFDSARGQFDATPALYDGKIFLRSTRYLYCVGQK